MQDLGGFVGIISIFSFMFLISMDEPIFKDKGNFKSKLLYIIVVILALPTLLSFLVPLLFSNIIDKLTKI